MLHHYLQGALSIGKVPDHYSDSIKVLKSSEGLNHIGKQYLRIRNSSVSINFHKNQAINGEHSRRSSLPVLSLILQLIYHLVFSPLTLEIRKSWGNIFCIIHLSGSYFHFLLSWSIPARSCGYAGSLRYLCPIRVLFISTLSILASVL